MERSSSSDASVTAWSRRMPVVDKPGCSRTPAAGADGDQIVVILLRCRRPHAAQLCSTVSEVASLAVPDEYPRREQLTRKRRCRYYHALMHVLISRVQSPIDFLSYLGDIQMQTLDHAKFCSLLALNVALYTSITFEAAKTPSASCKTIACRRSAKLQHCRFKVTRSRSMTRAASLPQIASVANPLTANCHKRWACDHHFRACGLKSAHGCDAGSSRTLRPGQRQQSEQPRSGCRERYAVDQRLPTAPMSVPSHARASSTAWIRRSSGLQASSMAPASPPVGIDIRKMAAGHCIPQTSMLSGFSM